MIPPGFAAVYFRSLPEVPLCLALRRIRRLVYVWWKPEQHGADQARWARRGNSMGNLKFKTKRCEHPADGGAHPNCRGTLAICNTMSEGIKNVTKSSRSSWSGQGGSSTCKMGVEVVWGILYCICVKGWESGLFDLSSSAYTLDNDIPLYLCFCSAFHQLQHVKINERNLWHHQQGGPCHLWWQ